MRHTLVRFALGCLMWTIGIGGIVYLAANTTPPAHCQVATMPESQCGR